MGEVDDSAAAAGASAEEAGLAVRAWDNHMGLTKMG